MIIGHRGLPGLYPEETLPSYEGAVDAVADSLEEDVHLTKDCVLVARHNPWLSDNTNIAEIAKTNPTVAARKRTVPGVMVNVTYSVSTYGGPAQYLSDRTDPADPRTAEDRHTEDPAEFPDGVVAAVRDIQIPGGINGDAGRLVEVRGGSGNGGHHPVGPDRRGQADIVIEIVHHI